MAASSLTGRFKKSYPLRSKLSRWKFVAHSQQENARAMWLRQHYLKGYPMHHYQNSDVTLGMPSLQEEPHFFIAGIVGGSVPLAMDANWPWVQGGISPVSMNIYY